MTAVLISYSALHSTEKEVQKREKIKGNEKMSTARYIVSLQSARLADLIRFASSSFTPVSLSAIARVRLFNSLAPLCLP